MGFGKGSRGPRKKVATKQASPVVPAATVEEAKIEVLSADTDKEYFFKSKYRRDSFTLIKPTKIKHDDGTRTVDPGKVAEFDHNTWTTRNAYLAGILREAIAARPELGIVETTPE